MKGILGGKARTTMARRQSFVCNLGRQDLCGKICVTERVTKNEAGGSLRLSSSLDLLG